MKNYPCFEVPCTMSCPEKNECSPPPAKQRKVLETEEKNNGVLDLPASQEAEAAQTLWEMTKWRENAEDKEQTGNVIPHTPENGTAEDPHARLPVCTPERGDTGESATGTPHIPEGGETGEKNTTASKQDPLRRDAAGNGDSDDQRRRCAQPSLEIADSEEPAVLSPLSSDSETGDHRSCSEGDECCIVSVGTQDTSSDRSLQALESVQQELKSVNERADRALLQLKRRYGQLRKPHIQKRNAIIRTIPGFWVTAFLNHPQLSAMIDDRDEDTLSYMNNLQVEDFTHLKSSCKIKFYFDSNPYFKNDVIIKEFQYGSSGRLTSHSTPIQWWRGKNPSYGGKNSSTPSFFSWFSDHSFAAADRIATIIKEDLWPNPLQYYLIGEGESDDHPAEDSDPDNTDDCVVIVDDDDDDEEEDEAREENEEDDDDENDVHEISDNTEKHTEGTDNEDDDDEEDLEEESVPEEMVESTVVDETDNIVLDADDSENSSEEGGNSE